MSDNHRQAAFYNTCVTRPNVHDNPTTRCRRRRPVSQCAENEAKRLSVERLCMGFPQDDELLKCGDGESEVSEDALDNEKCVFNMADFYDSIPGKNINFV